MIWFISKYAEKGQCKKAVRGTQENMLNVPAKMQQTKIKLYHINILNLRHPEKKFFRLDRKRRGNIMHSMRDEL